VPGFHVLGVLGSGGFGRVWAARRHEDGTAAAIKIAHDGSQLSIARLEREANALAALGPNVPAYVHHGRLDDGRPFLAMEQLTGVSLARELELASVSFELASIRHTARALLGALDAIHEHGWIHRDLKPENVVRDDQGRIRLLDFGLAVPPREADVRLTRAGVAVGTLEYMAPEQLACAPVDLRADLYAFGVILFELLTSRPPFVGAAATIEHGHAALRPPRPSELASVPRAIEEITLACLAKQPDRRPASARAVLAAIDEAWPANLTRSSERRSAARSLLVERTQPVAVLATRSSSASVEACVTRFGGFVARTAHDLVVCAFAGSTVQDPATAALAAARELVGLGANVAMHVGRLTLRHRRSGAILAAGEIVDEPARWMPQAWTGLAMTEAFTLALPARSIGESRFVGRDHELARARRSVAACLTTRAPALLALTGGPGLGKTTLANEIAAMIECYGDIEIIRISAGADADDQVRSAIGDRAADGRLCAVIIDDAHRLDTRTLEAIEYVTLDHPDRMLCVVVTADPSLFELRPAWGSRAHHYDHVALVPLGAEATRLLVTALLAPADYIPDAFLDRVTAMTGGVPALVTRVVAELVRQGAVKKRDHGNGWQIVADVLDSIEVGVTSAWLAGRDLETLTPELAACVRVCSVLGSTFHAGELAAVIGHAEREGIAATSMDVDIALRELAVRGTLRSDDRGWQTFSNEQYCDGVYALLAEPDRRRIHALAAEYWLAHDEPADLAARGQLARHLEASDRGEDAAGVYASLGDTARAAHRYVDAERSYTASLRCTATPRRRCHALAGRGAVRALLHRTGDALSDLRDARALSERITDPQMTASLLLDEAAVADSAGDYRGAEAAARTAADLTGALDDPRLTARAQAAEGRSAWRRGDPAVAVVHLAEAVRRGDALGDPEIAITAQVLLGPALVLSGHLDEAERAFDDVIARCRRIGDRLHECAAYGNRLYLWTARKDISRAMEDLRTAIQIAREVGNPEPERVATHNLAELLLWHGALDEALPLAIRARTLQQRFWKDVPDDALLLARIHAARGELEPARALIAWIGEACVLDEADPVVCVLVEALRHLLGNAHAASWETLECSALPPEESIEVWSLRAQAALDAGDPATALVAIEHARAHVNAAPIWRARVDRLAARL
jgi:tetratricopeptide (TPR) repeat protein